ncbi:hypothetical protein KO488_06845 [Poseidonibacter lekithochrous]|uniref:hypothetical protein n=1 Tax=Poseidonibacter TaxID=2321187 RepID=UPI001C0962CA|nr:MULTISPECIES: hypothetical protein [Poseidonibacter]MBU3014471.1 hypothetical protein [Poseidonibacter lekithochrous]MDO6827769.1 hypothetical protein [Poseidonibacter sp. 1_MG-2023]
MKEIEVPKEENVTLNGMQKVMYTKDSSGDFIRENYGSNIEEFATRTAVDEYELLEKESLDNISKGISSPISFFMYKNRMDLPTLSSMVGMFQFRVKRHLQMKHFKKLNEKVLSRYAEVFSIKIEELRDFRDGK